jgi:hypothetical protein
MKLKQLLSFTLTAGLLSLSSNASADFFSGPFDMWDDDDYSRYNSRDGRGYGGDRWRGYDEWEPNYWRYRYFDNDSDDYFFDEFDGDFFGDGRGDMNFDMNMDFDADSRYDGDYSNDHRYRGDSRRYGSNYDRPTRRYDTRRRYSNEPRYQGSQRNNSQRYGNNGRRMSDTPQVQQRREQRRAEQSAECR